MLVYPGWTPNKQLLKVYEMSDTGLGTGDTKIKTAVPGL